MKYSLADHGEVRGVGGTVVLKQDHASQHHVYEDQSTAAESWGLVLSLNNLVQKNTFIFYVIWSYLLSHSAQEDEEIPAVVPVVSLGEVEILESEMDDVEKGGHHQN